MKGSSTSRIIGNLRFLHSDFHDNVQLLVRDGHRLYADSCDFNNNSMGIKVYNSHANISYCEISGNGTGLNLNYASNDESSISNCDISNNSGCGLITKDRYIDFEYNELNENSYDGMKVYSGGLWRNFADNTITNNGWSEYGGYSQSYSWAGMNNTISDASYSYSTDQYILKVFGWITGDPQVDVSGNTIDHSVTTRFWPSYDAFYFGSKRDAGPEILYAEATEYMADCDYESARPLFEEIISLYPGSFEAPSSIQMIYFIENYTNEDYQYLLSFLSGIYAEEGSELYRVKRNVITKTYMQMEDYNTAINRLEEVIADAENEIELTEALTDEAYCYVKLIELGSRSLPTNCSMMPQTFKEFQLISEELESKLYPISNPSDDLINSTKIALNNYPNPFNPTTTIKFSIPENNNVKLTIYNVKGQEVKVMSYDFLEKGNHSVSWNGTDANKKSVSSGIYFYKVQSGKYTAMKKMILLK